jgi:hypothetical protein
VDAARQLEQLKTLGGDAAAYSYAGIYAQWGEKAVALQWLSKAVQVGDPHLQLLKVDWELNPLRDNPEFGVIEGKLDFPP